MSDQEREQFLEAAKSYKAEITSSKKAARQFLVGIGVITKKGNFRKPFTHLCIPQGRD